MFHMEAMEIQSKMGSGLGACTDWRGSGGTRDKGGYPRPDHEASDVGESGHMHA